VKKDWRYWTLTLGGLTLFVLAGHLIFGAWGARVVGGIILAAYAAILLKVVGEHYKEKKQEDAWAALEAWRQCEEFGEVPTESGASLDDRAAHCKKYWEMVHERDRLTELVLGPEKK